MAHAQKTGYPTPKTIKNIETTQRFYIIQHPTTSSESHKKTSFKNSLLPPTDRATRDNSISIFDL
jgi:transposase